VRVRALFSSGLLAVVLLPAAGATTYVVHPDGTGDSPTIQAAIDASSDGDVVELTNGTFTGDGNRDLVGTGVDVLSGWPGARHSSPTSRGSWSGSEFVALGSS
jgi:hypothetical protein